MDKVVIEDNYHMIKMDENVNWMQLTLVLSKKSLNLQAPFCICIYTSNLLIAFPNKHIREKQFLPLMCIRSKHSQVYGKNAPVY